MSKKPRLLFLSAIMALPLCLTSCFFIYIGPDSTSMSEKRRPVYSLVDGQSKLVSTNFSFKAIPEDEATLYLTVKQYADLLNYHTKSNHSFKVDYYRSGAQASFLGYSEGEVAYQAIVDVSAKTFHIGGSLSGFFTHDADYSRSSLNIEAGSTSRAIIEPKDKGYATYSFQKMELQPVYSGSEYYYPLSLLDAVIGSSASISHFYDFSNVSFYNSSEQVSAITFADGYTAAKRANLYYASNGYPLGLGKQTKDVIYYTFDNRYGLASTRGIASIADAFDKAGYGAGLKSSFASVRSKAVFNLFGSLDDDHTGLTSYAAWYGEDADDYVRGPNSVARSQVRQNLTAKRAAAGYDKRDVVYAKDGKTAYFNFDSFSFAKDAYVPGTTDIRDDLYKEDSYFLFKKNLEEIVSHGGIEDLVIDVSLNGGGTVGIMLKLLALFGEDGKSSLDFAYDDNGGVYRFETTLRTGKVYDDAFKNIYILTSPMSFSCGNAFPFFARRHLSKVKVIGVNSGGGECTVANGFLPTGASFAYSSPTHLGDYDVDANRFHGTEVGTKPDVSIDYDHYYDIDLLAADLAS